MPLPASFIKSPRPSMRDEVYNTLLNCIMDGTLKPGEKIVDKELAEQMGVSRTPVREAIRRLEDKGLVESAANRWTRISKITARDAEEIYPIIWTLEQLAASEACKNMRPRDINQMQAANRRLKAAIDAKDAITASKADAELHAVLIERSQNEHLIKTLGDLKIKYRRLEVNFFEQTSYDDSSVKEHDKLIDYLKNKDAAAASELICTNWKKSLERFRTLLSEAPGEPDAD